MSGHSKWAQIRHKKGITDKKRGQIFSKLSRLITLAARKGSDPKTNINLAHAIEQARAENMPSDNIERAIKKVSDKSQDQLEEIAVDAIGPGGVAFKIKAITDNKNRTIAEVKNILAEHHAKMVPPGSLEWMFSQPTVIDDEVVLSQIDQLMHALDDQDDVEDVMSNIR